MVALGSHMRLLRGLDADGERLAERHLHLIALLEAANERDRLRILDLETAVVAARSGDLDGVRIRVNVVP
jgi:hypothetical protein